MIVCQYVGNDLHVTCRSVAEATAYLRMSARSPKRVALPAGDGSEFGICEATFTIREACEVAEVDEAMLLAWQNVGFRVSTGKLKLPRLTDIARICATRELAASGAALSKAIPAAARISRKLLPHVLLSPSAGFRLIDAAKTRRSRKSFADPDFVTLCLPRYFQAPVRRYAVVDVMAENVWFCDSVPETLPSATLVLDLKELGERMTKRVCKFVADIVVFPPAKREIGKTRIVVLSVT